MRYTVAMSANGYLRGLPGLLRRVADRLDPSNAPRQTSCSFTFEPGRGLVFHEDGRGCPIYYVGQDDYARAHNPATP